MSIIYIKQKSSYNVILLFILWVFALTSCAQNRKIITQETIINNTLKELNIGKSKTDGVLSKVSPSNSKETIIIVPEVEGDTLEPYDYSLTSHIVILNAATGEIKNYFSENSKANDWFSGAEFIDNISIDTKMYKLTKNKVAFGINVSSRTMSQPNPYNSTYFSLYIKEGNTLKKVLNHFMVYEYSGIVNVNMNACYADIESEKNELVVTRSITNGYYDILVKKTITQINYHKDENDECNPEGKIIFTGKTILKFNGEKYKEDENSKDSLQTKQLLFFTETKAIKKLGTPSSTEQFILNDAQGEFRNGISDKYTLEERQSESIVIDEITWQKDKNTWVTVWYEVQQEKSIPKHVFIWKKGTEF